MWPQEVRGDLRAGIKAKNQGDLDLSERYLRRYVSRCVSRYTVQIHLMYAPRDLFRAWQTAQTLPISALSSEPYLKLSGIAIALAEVLEASNRPSEAYETYSTALAQLRASQTTKKTFSSMTVGYLPCLRWLTSRTRQHCPQKTMNEQF